MSRMEAALERLVTERYSVRPRLYATPGRAAAAARLAAEDAIVFEPDPRRRRERPERARR